MAEQIERKFIRVRKDNLCPVCGHDSYCRLYPDYVVCNRVESEKPSKYDGGGWVHGGLLRYACPSVSDSLVAFNRQALCGDPLASPCVLNAAYTRMLSGCKLFANHDSVFSRRGMNIAMAREAGYRSLYGAVDATSYRSCTIGVPGFFDLATCRAFFVAPGLLIPYRDHLGRITGLQVRPDNPIGKAKYLWVSSRGKPGGTAGKACPHYSFAKQGKLVPRRLWITEGALKADSISHNLTEHAVGIPGTGCVKAMERSWCGLFHDYSIVLAMDQDNNPGTAEAERKLSALCRGVVYKASWDKPYKGIDDALAADCEITIKGYARKSK